MTGRILALACLLATPIACDDADEGGVAPALDAAIELDAATGRPDFNAPPMSDARVAPDVGAPDVGTPDVGTPDAALPDMMADFELPDADLPDMAGADMTPPDMGQMGGPLPGFGDISGTCGVLTPEILMSPEPLVVVNEIDFGDDPYDDGDYDQLTAGGQRILDEGNAGGSSEYSEVFAFEVLARCEAAELLKTENQVAYVMEPGAITDFLAEIDELKIGVSVTRAFIFPPDQPYPFERAVDLLNDKLAGVLESSGRVLPEDAWSKQILHVIAYAPMHAEVLQMAYETLDDELTADTIVWITISEGDDDFLY